MYKVFFNGSQICFTGDSKNSPKHNKKQPSEKEILTLTNKFLTDLKNEQKVDNLTIYHSLFENIWRSFRAQFIDIQAAGGLVKNADGEFLWIKRWGLWDLPKGKIENGEPTDAAALREVEEECGISGMKVAQKIGSSFHLYQSPYHPHENNMVLKETHWFEMSYSGEESPCPQTEEDITEARWINRENIQQVLSNTYPNIRELWENYMQLPNH